MKRSTKTPEPQEFDDLVFEDQSVADALRAFAENRRHGHLLLHGALGTGKSTAARVIRQQRYPDKETADLFAPVIGCDMNEDINEQLALIERGWAIHRLTGADNPIAIIDEVDQLGRVQQNKLRSLMDQAVAHKLGYFIFTTNHVSNIDPALVHRCECFEVRLLTPSALKRRCHQLLRQEGIKMPDKQLVGLLDTTDGSWRETRRLLDRIIAANALPMAA